MNSKPLDIAVVGATGAVGGTMIRMLRERRFPIGELRLLASARSAGRTVDDRWHGASVVSEATAESFEGVDIALFSAGGDTSKALAPLAAERGATVIDNSSAWRMDPNVPLVVSQVNPDDLERHEGIIANPNCSTMQLVPVLMALRDAVGLERVVVDTYQAVSGTGGKAIKELQAQLEAHVGGQPLEAQRLPPPDRAQRPPAGRCLPRQRLHQGRVEGRDREPQDPASAGPARLVHGGPCAGLRGAQRSGPRRDP